MNIISNTNNEEDVLNGGRDGASATTERQGGNFKVT
jgi:hypothetical protein